MVRSWWQKIKQHPVATGIVVLLVLVFILFIFTAYRFGWDWTGFNSGTSQITVTSTSKGNYAATLSQPSKSLWDWLGLLAALAIPVVVGFGAAWFTTRQGKVADAENKDNQRENALQAYIDKMSELLLHEELRWSKPENEARKVARVRTLTVLPRLDSLRKRTVIQFLYESGLIDKDNRIIELQGADLYQADLRWLRLENAHLGGAFCWKVDFSAAILHGAYLGGVEFREVTWNRTDLSEAYLNAATFLDADGNKYTTDIAIEELEKQAASLKGATMPDGSIHN
jgi:hypothetical protein